MGLLNDAKTQNIYFNLKQPQVHYVSNDFSSSGKLIGFIIDDILTWYTHIEHT